MTIREIIEQAAVACGWTRREPILPIDGFRFVKDRNSIWVYFDGEKIDEVVVWEKDNPERRIHGRLPAITAFLEAL
jgi:hypothetical protein